MSALAPAFTDPAGEAQSVFRAVMDAMARPGHREALDGALTPPRRCRRGAGAIALTLLDFESPVWLDEPFAASPDVTEWLRFHTGAPHHPRPGAGGVRIYCRTARTRRTSIASRSAAPNIRIAPRRWCSRSTACPARPMRLTGPGIAGARAFSSSPLPGRFRRKYRKNHALFPRGVDLLFVTADAVVALPRSTRVDAGG